MAAAGAATAWWWFVRCEQDCARADRSAQLLFDRGELLVMLALIDAVDVRCRCGRFTQGDVPPQYALAHAALQEFFREGRRAETERLLAQARSPMLKDLARRLNDSSMP